MTLKEKVQAAVAEGKTMLTDLQKAAATRAAEEQARLEVYRKEKMEEAQKWADDVFPGYVREAIWRNLGPLSIDSYKANVLEMSGIKVKREQDFEGYMCYYVDPNDLWNK